MCILIDSTIIASTITVDCNKLERSIYFNMSALFGGSVMDGGGGGGGGGGSIFATDIYVWQL